MLPPTRQFNRFLIEQKQTALLQHAKDDFGSEVTGWLAIMFVKYPQQLTNQLIEWYDFLGWIFWHRSAL
jgi:hypothetical protein